MNPNRSCNSGVHHVASAPAWPSGSCSFHGSGSPGKPGTPRPDRTTDPRLRAAARPSLPGASVNSPRGGGWPRAGKRAELGTARGHTARGTQAPPPSLRPRLCSHFWAVEGREAGAMQSESGIVPDFEVGEEFHEEPKTYYELKSQPLKSRWVVTAGGRRGARLGAPCPTQWGEESRSSGLWDKDPVSLPGGRGRTAPAVGGPRPPGLCASGGSVQVRCGGVAGSLPPPAQVRGPWARHTGRWDRVGAGERPGEQVGEEERGNRTLSRWEGEKKSFWWTSFLKIPAGWVLGEGVLGVDWNAALMEAINSFVSPPRSRAPLGKSAPGRLQVMFPGAPPLTLPTRARRRGRVGGSGWACHLVQMKQLPGH